jgi:hypothetical protein
MVTNSQRSTAPLGYVIECHGAQIRAQLRSVATVVEVTGRLSAYNWEAVVGRLCRFTRLRSPLVLDFLDCQGLDPQRLEQLLHTLESHCEGTELTLVLDPAVGIAGSGTESVIATSVAEALSGISARIKQRRSPVFSAPLGRPRSLRSVKRTMQHDGG